MVDCMSLADSLERRSRALVLKSCICPLDRSPLAAAINWVTAHSAKVKSLAKLEPARKEDENEKGEAVGEVRYTIDLSRLATKADMKNIEKQLDDLKEEMDKLLEGTKKLLEDTKWVTKAVEARAKPL